MADTRPGPMDEALADRRPAGGYRAAHLRHDDLGTVPDRYRAAHYRSDGGGVAGPGDDWPRESPARPSHNAQGGGDVAGPGDDWPREDRTPPGGYRVADYRAQAGEDDHRDGFWSRQDGTPPGGYRVADYRAEAGEDEDEGAGDFWSREDRTPPGRYRVADLRAQVGEDAVADDDGPPGRTPPGGYRVADYRVDDEDDWPPDRTPPGGYRAADRRHWVEDDVPTPAPEPMVPEPPPPGAGRAPNPPPAPAAAPALLPPSPPVAAGVAAVFAAGLVAACVVLVALRWPDPPAGGGPLAALDAAVSRGLAADRILSVATWVENVATLLVVGGACFRLYVSRPAITGRGASEPALVAASLAGIGACVLSVPLRAMVVSGRGLPAAGDLDALGLAATSRFGDAACVRLLALVLFAVTLARPPRGWGRRIFAVGSGGSMVGFLSVSRVTVERIASLVAGLIALASFTFVGHPQASRPRGFLLLSQAVHVTAAAVWFGGGALLAIEIHRRWRHDTPRAMAETIERFSTLAGVAVALVAITGIVLAHSQLASPQALYTTHYGRALVAKVGFVGLVAAIGGYNHSRLVPAVVERRDTVAWRHLGWTTAAEGTLIAVGVLVMTAAMTSGGI